MLVFGGLVSCGPAVPGPSAGTPVTSAAPGDSGWGPGADLKPWEDLGYLCVLGTGTDRREDVARTKALLDGQRKLAVLAAGGGNPVSVELKGAQVLGRPLRRETKAGVEIALVVGQLKVVTAGPGNGNPGK